MKNKNSNVKELEAFAKLPESQQNKVVLRSLISEMKTHLIEKSKKYV